MRHADYAAFITPFLLLFAIATCLPFHYAALFRAFADRLSLLLAGHCRHAAIRQMPFLRDISPAD